MSNPFRLSKVFSGLGFLVGLTLMGTPIALVFYATSFFYLRGKLRAFRKEPTVSGLKHAMDAVGTLTIAFLGNAALLVVLGGVVLYMVYFKS